MNIVHAIILAIVEGVSEFLPISSTGHLILAGKLLGIQNSEFTKSFEIFIQLGAIMAVGTLYWSRIWKNPAMIKPLLIAFLPTGILGVLLYKTIKTLFTADILVAVMLATIGLLLIMLEKYWKQHPARTNNTIMTLSPKQLLSIGLFQSFSMVPGVSRAAATIVGGMFMGLSRVEAVEFSFLLAVPTMAAATGLDLIKNMDVITQSGNLILLSVGFIVSWIVSLVVMKAFLRWVKHATFTSFGVYRICVSFVYLLIVRG
ncbi:undecaprenyl-diphosphate phosphatase [Candidatus Woesebacteria bacterium]|jgi:undecaprenyl-diphosphatase|nr:undecaprenyl-diphosphate phosphatase [Candidatus Woesebacteria bacterium]